MQENHAQHQRGVLGLGTIANECTQAGVATRRDLEVTLTISSMRTMANNLRDRELERALRRLGPLDPEEERIVRSLACNLVNRLLHSPTVRLKTLAAEGDGHRPAQLLRDLFGLPDSAPQ